MLIQCPPGLIFLRATMRWPEVVTSKGLQSQYKAVSRSKALSVLFI